MKKNKMLSENGNETIIKETKNELIVNICKNITKIKHQYKIINGNKIWYKYCKCGNEQHYTSISSIFEAKRRNSICWSCSNSGKNNPFFGKTHSKKHRLELSSKQKICSYRFKKDGKNPDRIIKNCKMCNTIFKVTKCQINRKYCTFQCATKDCFGFKLHRKTKPEHIVEIYLIENSIEYEYQYYLKNRLFDFYIPSKNLLIEVDGVYWHGKGLKYNDCNPIQRRAKINDKYKNRLSMENGYNLIRIWEDDVNNVSKYIC